MRCVVRRDGFRVERRVDLRHEPGPIQSVTVTGIGRMVALGDRNRGCRGFRIAYEKGLMPRKSLRS